MCENTAGTFQFAGEKALRVLDVISDGPSHRRWINNPKRALILAGHWVLKGERKPTAVVNCVTGRNFKLPPFPRQTGSLHLMGLDIGPDITE